MSDQDSPEIQSGTRTELPSGSVRGKPFKRLGRIDWEKRVVSVMIGIYCRGQHHEQWKKAAYQSNSGAQPLCSSCAKLQTYAHDRLNHCPQGEQKNFCGFCTIHCYRPEERQQIKAVMRYAGPRMLFTHPIMAFRHLAAKLRSR